MPGANRLRPERKPTFGRPARVSTMQVSVSVANQVELCLKSSKCGKAVLDRASVQRTGALQ
jgi:hypothetical protein